eukprot:gene2409-5351_t
MNSGNDSLRASLLDHYEEDEREGNLKYEECEQLKTSAKRKFSWLRVWKKIKAFIIEGIRMGAPFHIPLGDDIDEVQCALRQLRRSYLSTWWLVHFFVNLRLFILSSQVICKIEYSFMMPFTNACQPARWSSLSSCYGLVLPISPSMHTCFFANMTETKPVERTFAFDDYCPNDTFTITTVVPRGTFMVSYSWTGETLSAARSIP